MRDEMHQALRRMVYETGAYGRIAVRMEEECDWAEGSGDSRLSQMMNLYDIHQFPAVRLYIPIQESGMDCFSPLCQLALFQSQYLSEERKPAVRLEGARHVQRRKRA